MSELIKMQWIKLVFHAAAWTEIDRISTNAAYQNQTECVSQYYSLAFQALYTQYVTNLLTGQWYVPWVQDHTHRITNTM